MRLLALALGAAFPIIREEPGQLTIFFVTRLVTTPLPTHAANRAAETVVLTIVLTLRLPEQPFSLF